MFESEEQPTTACNVLLGFMQRASVLIPDPAQRTKMLLLVLDDLASKLRHLPPDIADQFFQRAKQLVGPELKSAIEVVGARINETRATRERIAVTETMRPRTDAVVLAVIQEEFEAALRVFGIDSRTTRKEFELRGRDVYRGAIANRRFGSRPIDVLISMVGKPRNVPCANVCRDVIQAINADVLILVGIAGGNRHKRVGLGDVVAADAILDIEGGRLELVPKVGMRLNFYRWDNLINFVSQKLFGSDRRLAPRIEIENPLRPLAEYIQGFRPNLDSLRNSIKSVLQQYSEQELPRRRSPTYRLLFYRLLRFLPFRLPFIQSHDRECNYHRGIIMCGEKVLADGSVPLVARRHHGNILAVDMESVGFSKACRHCDKPWVVFRGISDFADPKKGDNWHVPAAVGAAATAKEFLAQSYCPPDERDELF